MDPLSNPTSLPGMTPALGRKPQNPEEVAKQFEEVLVRQFVQTMTKGLFEDKDKESMLTGQQDLQADIMTDVLTRHLTEQGVFNFAEMLMRQWKTRGEIPNTGDDDVVPDHNLNEPIR